MDNPNYIKEIELDDRQIHLEVKESNEDSVTVDSTNNKNSEIHKNNNQTDLKSKEKPAKEKIVIEWSLLDKKDKILYVVFSIVKILMFIILLYLFLLSLSFMTIGFTLVSSFAIKWADVIRFILKNPFAALAIGIIATAIMQNATATTSIAVSMVGAGIIPDVKNAVPIIMGANIGTCVTNSFIALTLAGNPEEFKRAFSAATLNDIFNFLTTGILLPIEIFSGFLFIVSNAITELMPFENADQMAKANFIAGIINPVTDLFILLNTTAVDELSKGNKDIIDVALRCCNLNYYNNTDKFNISTPQQSLLTAFSNGFSNLISNQETNYCAQECKHWCMPMLRAFGDGGTGLFWIILSIIVLISCLFGIVKVLSLLIVGPIAKAVQTAINASFKGKLKWVSQLILFLVAFTLTLIVQSSNIITATLVPLCGIGIVSLQRVYVMTLGSNIGTTVTGILSAFTQPPSSLKKSLQLAFVYSLFNILGVVFWLPVRFLRLPKRGARKLGKTCHRYKWFLYFYVFSVYFIIPLIVFGLALIPNWIGLGIAGIPIIVLFVLLLILKFFQKYFPQILPNKLRNFNWLPLWLRSLEPIDKRISKITCLKSKKEDKNSTKRSSFPELIRRMSAVDSIIKESKSFNKDQSDLSSDEDGLDKNTVNATNKPDIIDTEKRVAPTTYEVKGKIVNRF